MAESKTSMKEKMKSRKFIITCVSILGGFAGLFLGFLDGGTLVALLGAVFAFYGTSSAVEKNIQKRNN